MLSLRYLGTLSDEPCSKAGLYKNIGLKSGKKCPWGPVIDMTPLTIFFNLALFDIKGKVVKMYLTNFHNANLNIDANSLDSRFLKKMFHYSL